MQKIKFRGKRVDNGNWVYGSLIIEPNLPEFKSIYSDIRNTGKSKYLIYPIDAKEGRAKEVIPETVGQYIGIEDKNGKEIYKGDIVKARERNNISKKKHKQEVIFYYGCFMLAMLPNKIRLRNIAAPLMENDVEIIGNKFDNPELLKG